MPGWPPSWQVVARSGFSVQGELDILEDVSANQLIANKIFRAMEHQGARYIALLAFDDELFTKQLYPLLAKNIGRSIQEIGDLDLSHLL